MENVRNRVTLEVIKKYESNKFIKQQIELTFIGNHKSYEN